jgi:hypothetical protein
MSKFTRISVLLFLGIELCQVSRGQNIPDQGSASVIRALEHDWAEGQGRNDNHTLDLIFDNTLVYLEYGKLVSKGEYLARVKGESADPAGIAVQEMTVHLFGSTGIVTGTYREKQLKRGQPALKQWRFIDTWVYKKNGWVLVAAAAAPILR